MIRKRLILLMLVSMLAMTLAYPQKSSAMVAARKKEQIDRDNKKEYELARKKTLKHRREIQTKETRERMDEADKRAKAYNRQNEKRWWEKIFKKKRNRK
jgi:hypothetical protein